MSGSHKFHLMWFDAVTKKTRRITDCKEIRIVFAISKKASLLEKRIATKGGIDLH